MILTRTGPRSVRGEKCDVEDQFPERFVYRDGNRHLSFSAERTAFDSPASILSYDDGTERRWKAPHEPEKITDETYREILVRVNAALVVLGIRADWQTLPPERERGDWAAIRSEAAELARGVKSAWV